MSDPEEPDNEERYLPADEVAENLRDYLDVLEVEHQVAASAANRLEDGTLAVEDMVESMPTKMPLEDWQRDQFDHEGDYSLDTVEGDDGGE